jgi:hypothetical protein
VVLNHSSPTTARTAAALRSASCSVGPMTSVASLVFVISAGSRPTDAQCCARTSSLCLIVGMSPKMLEASAYFATSRRVRFSPLPPIMIGGPPGVTGRGTLNASTIS